MMKDFGAYAVLPPNILLQHGRCSMLNTYSFRVIKIQTQAIITANAISTLVLFLLHFIPAAALIALSLIRLCF